MNKNKRMLQIILDENNKIPLIPDDTVWSIDGRVYVKYIENRCDESYVGVLNDIENNPGHTRLKLKSSGDGFCIPVDKIKSD